MSVKGPLKEQCYFQGVHVVAVLLWQQPRSQQQDTGGSELEVMEPLLDSEDDHVNGVSAPPGSAAVHPNPLSLRGKSMLLPSAAHAHHHVTVQVLPSQLQSGILNVYLRHQFTLTFDPDPLRGPFEVVGL